MPPKMKKTDSKAGETDTKSYRHTEAESLLRPDVGTQAQFRKKKPPVTYRYDSSLSPSLAWDGQNYARETGEWLIGVIEKAALLPTPHAFDRPQELKNSRGQVVATVRGLHDAVEQLKRICRPFLNWAGKAERLSFDDGRPFKEHAFKPDIQRVRPAGNKTDKNPPQSPFTKGGGWCGFPHFETGGKGGAEQITHYQVELLGLDIFDPVTMENDHRYRSGNDVPAWFLDTDYNGLCFHVCQAFFPRTGAWDNLKRALKGSYEETVWEHLAGTKSVPFEAGEHRQVAVKVIDDRGNELMVVKGLKEVKE